MLNKQCALLVNSLVVARVHCLVILMTFDTEVRTYCTKFGKSTFSGRMQKCIQLLYNNNNNNNNNNNSTIIHKYPVFSTRCSVI